jgi:hypothetical protein
MSLSERDLQVLAELEHDLGRPSAGTRLYLLFRASRSAWHGLLPVLALAAGAGLLAAGILVGPVAGGAAGELLIVAGISAISYAVCAAAIAWPGPQRGRKRA